MSTLKEKLQSIKDKEGKTDLYTHLSNVLTKILLDNPRNAYELLEDYSINVRQSNYEFKNHQEFDNAKKIQINYEELKEVAEKTTKLINKINVGTPEEPQDPGPCGYVPNMMEESKLFEWAGISFGQEETFKIFKSLTLLSVQKQAKNVRLWGKILGSKKDYYIAEGQADTAAEDGDLPPSVEVRGTGVNRLNYWVSTDILTGEWTELPLIQPHHIITARKIKYIFTGNLDADVITNPFFFGKEKHLLKAQIVRISHSTTIYPKGQFIVREGEEREIDPAEDYKWPSFQQLSNLDMWVHQNPNILKCGRLTILEPTDVDGDKDPAEILKQLQAADPYEPRLKPLSEDIPPVGFLKKCWKIKVLGDSTDYNPLARDLNQKVNYGVIMIRSLVWHGLVTVIQNKQSQQMYVGYGFKIVDKHFFPKEPQPVQIEVTDKNEWPEPNFPPENENEKKAEEEGPE